MTVNRLQQATRLVGADAGGGRDRRGQGRGGQDTMAERWHRHFLD
jgi:hypothetical protein